MRARRRKGAIQGIAPVFTMSRDVIWSHGEFVSFSFRFAVEDFGIGVGADANYFRLWPETNRPVKNSFELADGLVHNHHRRALGYPNDAAKPAFNANYVTRAKSKRIPELSPEKADKFGL
jgi:hypothetical protein